jgi:16S rRNA (cytidine1402-2'-O)-methyltransferase
MCLLSVSGSDMRQFLFRGFLPAEREERAAAMNELARERRPVILMDTPYRMGRLLTELAEKFPERRVLLGCDFTQSTETVVEARAADLPKLVGERKAEFILALYPGVGGTESRAMAARADRPPSRSPRVETSRESRDSREQRTTRKPNGGRKFTPGRRK